MRRCTTADAQALAGLRWRWRTEEEDERGVAAPDFGSAFERWFTAHCRSHVAFIAEADGTPVGMAWLVVVDRIPSPARWRRRAGLVQSVYVVPEWRRQGAGTALMHALIDRAASLQLDYLALHSSQPAIAFYSTLGFSEREDALELELRQERRASRGFLQPYPAEQPEVTVIRDDDR